MLIAHRPKDIRKINANIMLMLIINIHVQGGKKRLQRTLQSYGLRINEEHLVANTENTDSQLKFSPQQYRAEGRVTPAPGNPPAQWVSEDPHSEGNDTQ